MSAEKRAFGMGLFFSGYFLITEPAPALTLLSKAHLTQNLTPSGKFKASLLLPDRQRGRCPARPCFAVVRAADLLDIAEKILRRRGVRTTMARPFRTVFAPASLKWVMQN
jgi:hypothetical protein